MKTAIGAFSVRDISKTSMTTGLEFSELIGRTALSRYQKF